MAAASPVQGLQEEATCSICLEYYTDPVTTRCGHNFCRSCIRACSGGADAALSCPQCRELCLQGDLKTNRQLQNMVQLVKNLSMKQERPPEEEGLCEKHKEKLKLFCEEDETLICVICQVSSEHKQHNVSPAEEAAQKYKRELQDCLKPLRAETGAVQQCKLKEQESYRLLRNNLEAERKKIATEFEGLRQLLKQQEETLLRRIEEMDKKIISAERLKMAKLSAEMSSLEDLVREIEKKCEQPAGELLKDIRSTLSRSHQKFICHVPEEPMQQFPDSALIQYTDRHRLSKGANPSPCEDVTDPTPAQIKERYKELVTLDADTAHRYLTLSEGGRRVTSTGRDQRPPSNPRRFTGPRSVLGREGFSSGRHYWELQPLGEGSGVWIVGVARESVRREGGVIELPEEGVWAVFGYNGQYWALTSPPSRLSPRQRPRKLGLYLDYAGGRLSLYNADTLEELHTFTGAAFTGRVRPYLRVGEGAEMRLV